MRRAAPWIVLLTGLMAIIAAGLVSLPKLVRVVAIRQLRVVTGREVSIGPVALNLLTGRLAISSSQLHDRTPGAPPVAQFDRLEARFRLLPLLRGRVQLDAVTLERPILRVLRTGTHELNVSDLIDLLFGGEPSKRPLSVALDRFSLTGGALVFADRTVSPPQTWEVMGLTAEARDIVTVGESRQGTVSVKFSVNGAPVSVVADQIRVRPSHARAALTVEGLDLEQFGAYIPARWTFRPDHGRFSTRLALGYAPDTGTTVNGHVTLVNFVLDRVGQSQPFVFHPRVDIAIRDLTSTGQGLAIKQVEMAGAPTIVDGSVSPAQRFTVKPLRLVIREATWPSRGPARVEVSAALGPVGSARIEGTLDPGTLAADVRVDLRNVDLSRLRGYLPSNTPVTLERGRLTSVVRLQHDRPSGVRLGGDGTLADLVLLRRGDPEPLVSVPSLGVAVRDLVVRGGAVSLKSATITGDPTVREPSISPPQRFTLNALRLGVEHATWPVHGPARVDLSSKLPTAGTLSAQGAVDITARTVDLHVVVADAALEPYQPYLRLAAPLSGLLSADMNLVASLNGVARVNATGTAGLDKLALGPQDRPPLTVGSVSATGIDVAWPSQVSIAHVTITNPSVVVERDKDRSFPLRAMLTPRPVQGAPPAPTPAASADTGPGEATSGAPTDASTAPLKPVALRIGELTIVEGTARFVDNTVTPPLSEEMTHVNASATDLTNDPGRRVQVSVQSVVDATGALDARGEIAPFGTPFYLDLSAELRDFVLPHTSPYLRQVVNWLIRTGELSTKAHYRIVGDQLEASHDLVVERLSVARGPEEDQAHIGLPLGLIVSLITDSQGGVRFSVPLDGKLNAPEFSWGSAIWAAVKGVLTNLATAPFRAIGKIFQRDEEVEALKIDPIEFEPGTAVATPRTQAHLERVAEFLRKSPNVKLALSSVVGARDMVSLKTQEATALIQAAQREKNLSDFAEAADQVFKERYPAESVLPSTEKIVATLRDSMPAPTEPARALAARRLEVTRDILVRHAGIETDRLSDSHAAAKLDDPGPGRVELDLGS